MWIGADDKESLQALERAIDLGAQLHRHRARLRRRALRAARRPDRPQPLRDRPRRDEGPAAEHALARVGQRSRGRRVPRRRTSASARRRACATSGSRRSTCSSSTSGTTTGSTRATGARRSTRSSRRARSATSASRSTTTRRRRRWSSSAPGVVDTVQVIYNVFDQSPEDELFPAVAEHGVGVLARVPFDEGGLTGSINADSQFPEGDFRASYFRGDRKQQVAERVQAIVDDLGIAPRRDRRDGAALRPLRRRRLDRDPGHALDPQRRAQHRRRRRARAAARAGREAARAPLGAQLLPLTRAPPYLRGMMDLDPVEVRILGCLIEKQRTTPDAYPLSLNSLRLACNQTTNRDPVVQLRRDDDPRGAAPAEPAPLHAARERPHEPCVQVPPPARRGARARRGGARGARRAAAARRPDARRAQAAHGADAGLRRPRGGAGRARPR